MRGLPAAGASSPASAVVTWLDEQAIHHRQGLPGQVGACDICAQCHELTVVTRNVQDFALYPQVFNPWVL